MTTEQYQQAHEAYQQAVYRDGSNWALWCSIGILYHRLGQHRDALDAFTRSVRLDDSVATIWFDLGTLYESCEQWADAHDAYERAVQLAPQNTLIQQRAHTLSERQKQLQQTATSTEHTAQTDKRSQSESQKEESPQRSKVQQPSKQQQSSDRLPETIEFVDANVTTTARAVVLSPSSLEALEPCVGTLLLGSRDKRNSVANVAVTL